MADSADIPDTIVIGGGVIGLWTAYSMVNRGLNVILLDQFQLPNKRGSSGGATRFIRFFSEHDYFMPILDDAFKLWKNLEEVSGEKLLHQMGSLQIHEGEDSKEHMRLIASIMKKYGLPHDVLDWRGLKQRFPMFRLSQDAEGIHDPSGTCLMAVRCNRVLLAEFLKLGGKLRDNEKVTKITPGEKVRVLTSSGDYLAKKVVLATGTWSKGILKDLGLHLPLVILPAVPCYWKEREEGSHSNAAGMPIFAQHFVNNGFSQFIYGIPSLEYPGMVKVATRGDVRNRAEVAPDFRDHDRKMREHDISEVKKYIQQRLPGLEHSDPAIAEDCVYTITPDMNYIVDSHPRYPNILIGTGGTCHGYRGAPVIGKLLTELAMGLKPSHDLYPFRVTRFNPAAKM